MTTPDTAGEVWTLEQAAQAMLDLAVQGAADFAVNAFLKIDEIIAEADAGTVPAEEAKLLISHTVTAFSHSASTVGDRIADFAGWTDAQRDELNRRRLATYEARLAQLLPMIGQRGCA